MGIFDFFKKKDDEPHYDSTNITVHDLDKNFVFDYDLRSWVVEEMFEYDWGDSHFSRSFNVFDGKEHLDLHIEQDKELEIALTKPISVRKIAFDFADQIVENGKAPTSITYNDKVYILENEYPGYFRNVESEESREVIMWLYIDNEDEHLINIEQWGEREFNAKIGRYLSENEISNILPGES